MIKKNICAYFGFCALALVLGICALDYRCFMKELKRNVIFFIGWILSPFTWWNDCFVNIPISYLIASILVYFTPMKFGALMVGIYWISNLVGICLVFFSGRDIMAPSKNKFKSFVILFIFVALYSIIMIWLDKHGKLLPLEVVF